MAPTKTKLVFEVLVGPWYADGEGPYSGVVEVEAASPSLIRLASAAHAAGTLNVTEGLDPAAVESQEASEKAQEAAYRDGRWQEGNQAQYDLDHQEGV